VTRDDLPDGGAAHFAKTIQHLRRQCPDVSAEVLVPDFGGAIASFDTVCDAGPDVFNHNIETVPRLYPKIRPRADYQRSVGILAYTAAKGMATKSGLMLGLGETAAEIQRVIWDLKKAGCQRLTIGQYLAPSKEHVPMVRYVPPREFEMWAGIARDMGFSAVASGPLVRSSYRAGQMATADPMVHQADFIRKAG
jgi:lipoic acid synthetase